MKEEVRKLFFGLAITSSLFLTAAASCGNDTVTCKPHAIRQDLNHPETFWVCNNEGNGEKAVTAPAAPPNHNWG